MWSVRLHYALTIAVILCLCALIEAHTTDVLLDISDEARRKKKPYFLKPHAVYSYMAGIAAIKIKVAVVVFTVLAIGALFFKMFIGYGLGRYWWAPSGPCYYSSSPEISAVDSSPPPSYHYHHDHDLDHLGSQTYYSRVPYYNSAKKEASTEKPSFAQQQKYHYRQKRNINGVDLETAERIIRSVGRRERREYAASPDHLEQLCKRRFVCESDVRAQHSFMAAYFLYFFSRDGLAKYRDRKSPAPRSMDDCARKYGECTDTMMMLHRRKRHATNRTSRRRR